MISDIRQFDFDVQITESCKHLYSKLIYFNYVKFPFLSGEYFFFSYKHNDKSIYVELTLTKLDIKRIVIFLLKI